MVIPTYFLYLYKRDTAFFVRCMLLCFCGLWLTASSFLLVVKTRVVSSWWSKNIITCIC